MSELFLVRHAQASFGRENYDRLSELGHQQSRWLGEYFADRGIRFDRIVTGTMERHRETAAGIVESMGARANGIDECPEWNEYDFLKLAAMYQEQFPASRLPPDADSRQLYRLLHKALLAWAADELEYEADGLERWTDFRDRVGLMLDRLRADRLRTVLVVSSGGALAIAVQHILNLPDANTIQLNLQTRNTGLHHCFFNERTITLSSFNNVPHLDTGERRQYITYA